METLTQVAPAFVVNMGWQGEAQVKYREKEKRVASCQGKNETQPFANETWTRREDERTASPHTSVISMNIYIVSGSTNSLRKEQDVVLSLQENEQLAVCTHNNQHEVLNTRRKQIISTTDRLRPTRS